LSGEPFNESIFFCSRFQRLSCPLAFFYTPGLVHALLQSNNDRVAYIESFSSLYERLTNTKFRAKASATDNTPQNNQALIGTLPYGMEYQVVAEGALAG
jgi:hypothetical protein